MRHSRSPFAVVGLLGLALVASGCDTLGPHRRTTEKEPPPDIFSREPVDPAKAEKKASWSPGSWSSEARDIEKNMMRNTPDANWTQ